MLHKVMSTILVMVGFLYKEFDQKSGNRKKHCLDFKQYLGLASVSNLEFAMVMPNKCLI